jgi:hypothetical protein
MQLFNGDFLKLYEELGELNEAKADTDKLVAFAGQDLTDRFLAIRNKLPSPENDLYYWIKYKTPADLEQRILGLEQTGSRTQQRKKIAEGATLVAENDHWKVYHITTFEASQYYGRDTRWCITGINNWGDKYWNEYTQKGVKFWFFITKENYDPRGFDSKFALCVIDDRRCEVYNQQDQKVSLETIPNIDDISIPGLDLNSLICIKPEENPETCSLCGCVVAHPFDRFHAPYLALDHTRYCFDCLTGFLATPTGFKELMTCIANYNFSEYNLKAVLEEIPLTQDLVNSTCSLWTKAKKENRLHPLTQLEIQYTEEDAIDSIKALGFTVPASL